MVKAFPNIIVPTDFSSTAEKAFHFALNLASRTGSSILHYHAPTLLKSPFIDTEEMRKLQNRETESVALNHLNSLRNKCTTDYSGVEVSNHIGYLPFTDGLIDCASKNQMDLIIMGTQGASGLKKIIIGTNAAEIVQTSNLPILLIPEEFEGNVPEDFLFVFDEIDILSRGYDIYRAMTRAYRATTTFLLLQNSRHEEDEKVKQRHAFYERCTILRVDDFPINCLKSECISVINAVHTIEQKSHYDLLIMTKQKGSQLENKLLRGATRNMSFVTKKPMLILPASDKATKST